MDLNYGGIQNRKYIAIFNLLSYFDEIRLHILSYFFGYLLNNSATFVFDPGKELLSVLLFLIAI